MRGRRGTTEEGKGWMDTGEDTGEGGAQNERKEGRGHTGE